MYREIKEWQSFSLALDYLENFNSADEVYENKSTENSILIFINGAFTWFMCIKVFILLSTESPIYWH